MFLAVVALVVSQPDPPRVLLTRSKADGPVVVQVAALPVATLTRLRDAEPTQDQFRDILRVVVAGGADAAPRPPVAGTYSVADGGIRFEPQFPLVPGVGYTVTYSPAKLPGGNPKAAPVAVTLSLPKPPPGPPPAVTAVYPSASHLPENTLRLYVHFRGPMTRGDVYKHFNLIRDDGVEVRRPFLELDEEMWATDGHRLTVLFHPGRVKRGLVPREEEGPILEEGRRYTLVVSGKWEDAEGRALGADVRKSFTVGPPDDAVVAPETWAMIPPRPGSDAPLIVRLAKPLDHALLGRMLTVTDAMGKEVAGTITVGGGERVVTFAPAAPWKRGGYRLRVDTQLEDVCGNRVGEPFEVDQFKPVQRKIETKAVDRPFTVK